MSKRSQELSAQCWYIDPDTNKEEFDFGKFAKLIALDCAKICDDLQDVPATEPRHCAEDIRIRFEVK